MLLVSMPKMHGGYYFIAEKEQDKSVLYYDKNLEIFFASLKKDMAEIS